MLMNFNPLIKLLLFVPQGEVLSFFSFVRRTNLFSVSKFTCSPKKESEKLKNSHFGQIHVQFLLFTVSYWVFARNEHSLSIHISQLSHRTALWPFRTAPLQRPQSALDRLPIWNSQNCSMLPLAFVAEWLQGHWWGFISRNYVVWPTFLLMNVFIALKGSHFWFLFNFTEAGVVPCGGRKTSPRTSIIEQFIFYFGPLRSAIIFWEIRNKWLV